jgi:twitching motility two-component system response regulator PilH
MNRILLADDSPHAQRMGERILQEEGFEVVVASNGDEAQRELESCDPDLLLADVFLPGISGYELCRRVKTDPRRRHMRVVLTAGMLEPFDEVQARESGGDATIKKPFEASAVVETIRPLVEAAAYARGLFAEDLKAASTAPDAEPPAAQASRTAGAEIDPERVRAAITVALDRALPAMVEEITERVLIALGH